MRKGIVLAALHGAACCGKTAHKLCKAAQKKSSKCCCSQSPIKNFSFCEKSAQITKREDVITMKKSTLIAWVAFFSAIAGALAAAYFYIQRRERELEEYEQLLFSEDFCDEAPIDDLDEGLEDTDAIEESVEDEIKF